MTEELETVKTLCALALLRHGEDVASMIERAFNLGRQDGWNEAFGKVKQASDDFVKGRLG